jgi:RHS repeat-associated protein
MEDMPAYNNTSPNASNNYKYTQIGELKSDNQEEIQEIHWRVDSKISEITRTSGSAKKNLKFEYDAMGNRVAKHVYAGSVLESSTYYVRDAQGNVMGVYEHKMDAENAVMEYKLIERNIYGSSQVGICKDTVDLNITNSAGALTQATYYHARQLNHRQYSLSNHLGNVLTTIGDGKAATDSNNDGVIDYYTAYIISVSDYSPFGVELASRTWSIEEYRNGFNGKENDNEVKGQGNWQDYGMRMYDSRIVRFPSVDPITAKFPMLAPYQFASLNPIINIDLDGLEGYPSMSYEIFKAAGITSTTATQVERVVKERIVRASRISQDALIITGGVLTIVASGGSALPIVLGTVATSGGTAKFYFDSQGDYDKSDATPTTISGTVMVTANYLVGKKVFSESFKSTVEFVEGVATLDLKNLKSPNFNTKANEGVSILNLSIDAANIPENLRNILTPRVFSPISKPDQNFAPADATNVVMPWIPEIKPASKNKTSTKTGG